MDEGNYADFFLKPQQSPQRRYEALQVSTKFLIVCCFRFCFLPENAIGQQTAVKGGSADERFVCFPFPLQQRCCSQKPLRAITAVARLY